MAGSALTGAAAMGAFPPDIDAKRIATICPEHRGLVPEGISIGVVPEDGTVIAPAVTNYLGQPLAGDTDKLACAVCRIVHRRHTMAPCPFAVPEIEAFKAVVLVLGLAVIECAKFALFVEFAGGDC